MPLENVDIVTIYNEEDLSTVEDLSGQSVHLTRGRKTAFENFAEKVLNLLTGETVVSLLENLEGEDRLDASAIKNLPTGGGNIISFEFTNRTTSFINVIPMTANPSYVAVYIEGDRAPTTRFTTSDGGITFEPMLQAESGFIDYIP